MKNYLISTVADMADLMKALRNADAAGDTEAATRIAAMIKNQSETLQPLTPAAKADQRAADIPGEVPISQEEKALLFPRFSTSEQLEAIPETLASLATGATTGAAGYGAGSAVGAIGDLAGILTPEEAQELANRWASNLTYEPDSQASQQQLEAIGETLGVLPAVMGSAPMAGGIGRRAGKAPLLRQAPAEEIAKAKSFKRQGFDSQLYAGLPKAEKMDQLTSAITSGDKTKIAAMIDADPEIKAAMQDLGLKEPGLPSAQSKNVQFRETEQALKKMPGSSLSKIESDAIMEVQQKADNLITEYGGRSDKSALSLDLAERSAKSIDELGDLAKTAYDDIGASIPRSTKANLKSTGNMIKQELADLGGDVEQLSPLEKRLLKMSDSENVTYAAIDKIRKEVGETIGKQSDKFKSESSGALKRMYRSLTDDQEVTANDLGMGDQWKAAKQLVSDRKALEDNAVQMFGKNLSDSFMPKIGQGVKNLTKGDYKKFSDLMKSVPKSMREEVAVSALNDAFTTGSRKEKQLSIAGFSDWHNGLEQNKAAKNILYRELPDGLGAKIDSLAKVANGIRDAQAAAPVGGQIMAAQGVFDKVTNGFTNRVLTKLPGVIGDLASVGLEKSKSKGTDSAIALFSDPDFVRSIKAIAKGQEKKANALEANLMRTNKAKDFISTLTPQEAESLSGLGLMGWLSSYSGEDDEKQLLNPNP